MRSTSSDRVAGDSPRGVLSSEKQWYGKYLAEPDHGTRRSDAGFGPSGATIQDGGAMPFRRPLKGM
jgi:hypothetical protein